MEHSEKVKSGFCGIFGNVVDFIQRIYERGYTINLLICLLIYIFVELVSDLLLWTPTYGRAKAGRPARTYIQQLCEDTGCNSEDLPESMNDREKWREMVRDIRAGGTT